MKDIDPIIVIVEDDAKQKTSVIHPRRKANEP
jgi:hypothetical protein